mmetsp:Transcript_40736/g.121522  ORF Transcript_40736/g.121522 Transcript_40736/m.121522 type:complete len:324 (+) Transcript_40736:55-1026(+)
MLVHTRAAAGRPAAAAADRHAVGTDVRWHARDDARGAGRAEVRPALRVVRLGLCEHLGLAPVVGSKREHRTHERVHLIERDGRSDLHHRLVRVAVSHDGVSTRKALHHEVERVKARDLVGLLCQLAAVAQNGLAVTLKLACGEPMALQPADLLHADRRGSRPIARLGRNGERRHCTALAARVGDVEVDGYELRLARHVAPMQPESEDREQRAHHEGLAQVVHRRHWLDWQLAKDGQHVVMEQRVAEQLHLGRLLARCQRAVTKLVVHRRANRVARLDEQVVQRSRLPAHRARSRVRRRRLRRCRARAERWHCRRCGAIFARVQ